MRPRASHRKASLVGASIGSPPAIVVREPAGDHQHAQRDEERGQLEARDQEAVDRTDADHHRSARRIGAERPGRRQRQHRHHARQRHRRAERELDAAENQHDRLAAGGDAQDRRDAGDVLEVAVGGEARHQEREERRRMANAIAAETGGR